MQSLRTNSSEGARVQAASCAYMMAFKAALHNGDELISPESENSHSLGEWREIDSAIMVPVCNGERSLWGHKLNCPSVQVKGGREKKKRWLCTHWELIPTHNIPNWQPLLTRFPRLTLNQPFPTLTQTAPRLTNKSEPMLWNRSKHCGKKGGKKTPQLPWKLPSCNPLLRKLDADVPNSQGRACTFQPSDVRRTCAKRVPFGWFQ